MLHRHGIRLMCAFLALLLLSACASPQPAATTQATTPTEQEEPLMEKDAPLSSADALIQQMAADSMVLLKNENNCLPLAAGTKLNLFGYNATNKGFLLSGGGSGAGTWATESNKVTLVQAFRDAGVEINEELLSKYAAWDDLDLDDNAADGAPQCVLTNPTAGFYTNELMQQAKAFSDTAVVVISRWGRENGKVTAEGTGYTEIPTVQVKSGLTFDATRTYLQISTEEELMLNKVKANFDHVIVLLNLCNTMELGFLDDAGIDAAMFIGTTGQSGTRAIPKLLYGEITPSGKTADVYPYHHQADPTWFNARPDYTQSNNRFVTYQEGIYYGYRWYETAFAEKLVMTANGYQLDFSSEEGYRKIVQYPFGYGLSYTEFSWELVDGPADGTVVKAGSEYSVTVRVTNTGNRPGKDVVQLYLTPPYTPGGIEKAAVNLVAFGKTGELAPGESQDIALTFTDYTLASYDCYDANGNGNAGYEVEKGDYTLRLMRNAHEDAPMGRSAVTLRVETDIAITADPVTGERVENHFTGEDSYGSPVDGGVTYMTRADFAGTFPREKVCGTKTKDPQNTYAPTKTVVYGEDQGLYLFTKADGSKASQETLTGMTAGKLVCNEALLRQLADYDNEEVWDAFLSQITKEETVAMIKEGGFQIEAVESLGIPRTLESDGPSGLSKAAAANKIAWPAEFLIGCSWNTELAYDMGRSVGQQAKKEGIEGWYAPGVNLHRSPYTSRNFEYYSEDPVLSGALAAQVIRGAKNYGLTCYIKHFAASEGGRNPAQVNTWLTEQALREIYLKAFEIAIKEGGANAVMSAFNCIGDVYCGHNQALLQSILRGEWGFKGVVITDWWGEYMNIEKCVLAGNDKMLLKKETQQYMPLGADDSVNANAARETVKHMIYSVIAPYVTALDYEAAQTP